VKSVAASIIAMKRIAKMDACDLGLWTVYLWTDFAKNCSEILCTLIENGDHEFDRIGHVFHATKHVGTLVCKSGFTLK